MYVQFSLISQCDDFYLDTASLNDMPGIYQDTIFALVGLLPKLYEKLKIPADRFMDILQLIKYLKENFKDYPFFASRIPILLNRWLRILNRMIFCMPRCCNNTFLLAELLSQLAVLILSLIDTSGDFIIRYECCMCLKNIIKGDQNLKIDYGSLLPKLTPIILNLLDKFFSSNIVWPLLNLLNELLKKAQYTVATTDLIIAFQSDSFKKLLTTDSELLISALVETFKNIIVSFEPGDNIPSIFALALEFVDARLQAFIIPLIPL